MVALLPLAALTLLPVSAALAAPPAELADLPMVEVPVTGTGTRFVVLLSGDGGWAGIDKGLAAAFAAQNVPVAGLDSLRYFWKARTPEGLAADEQAAMQQKMMKYMMVFMGVMFFKVASGLCIYFIASSLWGLGERRCL